MSLITTLKKGLKKLGNRTGRTTLMLAAPLMLLIMVIPNVAFAAEESKSATEVIVQMVTMLNVFFQFLQFLLYPLLMIIASLMDNEMLIGPAMENKLRLIWVEIRNWVNMAFVLAMVGVAFYNVLGIGGDGSNYALKSILPKIVIGLVAVNFSFLAGKILIDSTAVLTNAVYALPTSSNLVDWDRQRDEMNVRLCKKPKEVDGVISYKAEEADERAVKDGSILAAVFCERKTDGEIFSGEFNPFGENFFNHFGQHNVSVALMVQMGNATDIHIPKDSGVEGLSAVTFSVLFGVFLFVMFGFAYVALAVVLLARVVVLWVCLALSPIAILVFVFPDLGQAAGGGNLDVKEKFFGHLLAPLVIGVVFSIGFTMLATLKDTSSGGWLGQIGEQSLGTIVEATGSAADGNTDQLSQLGDTFGKDLSNFQDLLIAVAAVVIIWMGTFAAAEKTVASSITNSIKSAGESTGKFIAKLPAYATVIPGHLGSEKDDSLNLMNVMGVLGGLPRAFEQKQQDKTNNAIRNLTNDPFGRKMDRAKSDIDSGTDLSSQATLSKLLRDRRVLGRPDELKAMATTVATKLGNTKLATDLRAMSDSAFTNWIQDSSNRAKLAPNVDSAERAKWFTTDDDDTPATTTPTSASKPEVAAAKQAMKPATNPPLDGTQVSTLGTSAVTNISKALADMTDLNAAQREGLITTGDVTQTTFDQFKGLDEPTRSTVVSQSTLKGGMINGAEFTRQVTAATATPATVGGIPAPATVGGPAPVAPLTTSGATSASVAAPAPATPAPAPPAPATPVAGTPPTRTP